MDIDLEKFFDNVPQDKLMSYVGRVIHAPDTESLIRKYLRLGVMGAVEIQWGQPYISATPGREERRPSGTPLHVSMAPAVSCRKGAKRPADSNKSPNNILSERQDSACENRANGHGTGIEWKCANLARPGKCRMKAGSRFPRHFAARHRTPCGRNPLPTSAPQGKWLAKGQTGFARGRTPSRAGKAFRSLVFPLFLHPQGVPCGKKVSSLRKAVHFFAESDSVFTAKKHPPRRRKESLSFWQEIPCLGDNPIRVL